MHALVRTAGCCLALTSPVWGAPPEPVPEAPAPVLNDRKLELGPDFGVTVRPADDGGPIAYSPAFVWGVHARAELWPWLGIRPWVRHALHPVKIERGGLAGPGDFSLAQARFGQKAIELWTLGIALEPTWAVSSKLRLWAGLGVYWGRIEAGQPSGTLDPCTSGQNCAIQSAHRTGVMVDMTTSVGAIFDLIPRWLAATATLEYGFVLSQSGAVFEPVQAFASGEMHHLRGLPKMRNSLTALLGIGVEL